MGISRSRRLVNKLWRLPTLVLVVLFVAGFTVKSSSWDLWLPDHPQPWQQIRHCSVQSQAHRLRDFRRFRWVGRVTYWDVNSKPIEVDLTALPWVHTEPTVLTTATADITAQVAGGNIGCRIIIDGQVRAEHTATGEHAGVWCQVLSA